MENLASQRFPEVELSYRLLFFSGLHLAVNCNDTRSRSSQVVEDYLDCGLATRIALNRRGNIGVTGLNDGRIVLYDLTTKLPRGVCAKEDAHGRTEGAAVVSLSFSRDSRYIASAGKDNVVKIWDTHTLKLLCQKEFKDQPIVKIEHIRNVGQCVVSFENAVPVICDCSTLVGAGISRCLDMDHSFDSSAEVGPFVRLAAVLIFLVAYRALSTARVLSPTIEYNVSMPDSETKQPQFMPTRYRSDGQKTTQYCGYHGQRNRAGL